MRSPSIVPAVLAFAALSAFAGCASSRDVQGTAGGASLCTGCHGGKDNETGAPPFDVHGLASSAAVGAHTAHVDAGVACAACHANVDPTKLGFPGHQNGVVDVIFSGAAIDPGSVATPAYDASTHTCSNVYCHSPSTAPGGSLPAPQWPGTITGCAACHPDASAIHGGGIPLTGCTACHPTSVDPTGTPIPPPAGTHADGTVQHFQHDPGWATTNANGVTPHGLAAEYQSRPAWPNGFDTCRTCHGSNLDNPIASTVPSCDSCHTGGTPAWRTTCTFCHGDATRAPAGYQLTDAAPPVDILGNTASPRVGAHQAHLFGIATAPVISNGMACDDCHGGTTRTLPTSFEPHANGTTEVTLKRPGQNAATGSFDPASGTCSNTYCHGNLPRNPVSPANVPGWTDTGTQKSCGTCHAPNGTYGASDTMTDQHANHRCARCHGSDSGVGCFACHGVGYQRQLGATLPTVNTTTHVDGMVEIVTSSQPLGFSVTITYDSTSQSCTTSCHSIGAHHSAGAPSGSATW